jgi:altronate dehydratase large subunit
MCFQHAAVGVRGVCFTTGNGTPTGNLFPVIKITENELTEETHER